MLGMAVTNERSDKVEALQPGESQLVVTTARAILQDLTTEYQLWQPSIADQTFRLEATGTGTAPAFRTARAIGVDATTVITMSRVNSATVRIASSAGTALNSATVQVGDFVKFEKTNDTFTSLFSGANQGIMFRVVAKGTGFVDVLDNGGASIDPPTALGGDFATQMKVLSPGPVAIGDTLELVGININNVGKYQVVGLSNTYLDVVAPLGVEEIFVGSQSVRVYDRLIGFLYVRANGPISLKIDDQTVPTRLARLNPHEVIFLGTVQAYKVEVVNDGVSPVAATVFHASVC
jgi:hypothetical protein